MRERTVQQILQENLLNAQRAVEDTRYPVAECDRATNEWNSKLAKHYNWLSTYNDENKKRRAAIIQLVGGKVVPKELLSRLKTQIAQSTIYEKLYDARNRPDYSTATAAAKCLSLQGETRSCLLKLLGWYDTGENPIGVTRRALLDEARRNDQWMGACGRSIDSITQCLLLADGTMEKLRKDHELMEPRSIFRVLITLAGCKSFQMHGEDSFHCFGIHLLEDGKMDRIACICSQAYVQLLPIYRSQVEGMSLRKGMKDRAAELISEEKAHKVFWGTMYKCLKKYDYAFRANFSGAFFARQNMEKLD